MNAGARIAIAIVSAAAAGLCLTAGATAAENNTPDAAAFYPLVGQWNGTGQLSMQGGEPTNLELKLSCSKAAAGWAVRCDMTAHNEKMNMSESDLMGVDAVAGQAHWYAITDQGDAHDHLVTWIDANTMSASYSWKQDGKQMTENITLKFSGKKSMEFTSTVTGDGKEVNAFSGTLEQ